MSFSVARAAVLSFGIVAVALILLVLVTQFDSLAIPGIILASVVLSLTGVLWGLSYLFWRRLQAATASA